MTLGVLIEALLRGPGMSTSTWLSTTTSHKKGGAREWIKNELKALSQLLGKLADKALALLPGIIGGWLAVSELVGTNHRCWSIDIRIFHNKCKEKVVI